MLGFLSRFVDSNDRELKRIHRGESVGALFSSEVSLTQEMLLWEDGSEGTIDTREGYDGQEAQPAGMAARTRLGQR